MAYHDNGTMPQPTWVPNMPWIGGKHRKFVWEVLLPWLAEHLHLCIQAGINILSSTLQAHQHTRVTLSKPKLVARAKIYPLYQTPGHVEPLSRLGYQRLVLTRTSINSRCIFAIKYSYDLTLLGLKHGEPMYVHERLLYPNGLRRWHRIR
jgi:hypothetical protein